MKGAARPQYLVLMSQRIDFTQIFDEAMRALVRDCNRAYRMHRTLHERDCEVDGFRWIEVNDSASSVFAWLHHGYPCSARITMPPLAALWLVHDSDA